MIQLYHGSGSRELQVLGDALPSEEWMRLRSNVCRLLRAREETLAADLLESIPFELREGTNFFGDEFSALYLVAPLEQYVELAEEVNDPDTKFAFQIIAITISEVGPYIRFIAVELDTKAGPAPVESPNLQITSDAVERALRDAEQLIHTQGAVSGLDRVHTALQGFFRAVCAKQSITIPRDASITALFKLLRENHPTLNSQQAHSGDTDRVLKAMATIVDALNPLRNRGSLAHPNESLLDEPEAMLVINSVRTLLHYFNAKLQP